MSDEEFLTVRITADASRFTAATERAGVAARRRHLTPWDLVPAVEAAVEFDQAMRQVQDVFDSSGDGILRFQLGDPNPFPRLRLWRWRG